MSLGICFADQLIHGWDVAKSTGQSTTMPSELAEAAFAMLDGQLTDDRRGTRSSRRSRRRRRPDAGPAARVLRPQPVASGSSATAATLRRWRLGSTNSTSSPARRGCRWAPVARRRAVRGRRGQCPRPRTERVGAATRHVDVFAARPTAEVAAASAEVLALARPLPELRGTTIRTCTRSTRRGALCRRTCASSCCATARRTSTPASLCFPSYWRLADKLGRPLADVHGPVPHYAAAAGREVDGFLRPPGARAHGVAPQLEHPRRPRLLPARRRRRPARDPARRVVPSQRAPALRRLDPTDAVLFTIRTQQVPLAALADRPDLARRMAARSRAGPRTRAYKGGHGGVAAQGWLASLSQRLS